MTRRRNRGFTLVELIIFIVVVGIGLAGILSVMNTVVKSSADPMVRKQAIAVAESMLEEIMLKSYADPNGGTNGVSTCNLGPGPQRAPWDDICDYNGYSHTGIVNTLNSPVTGLEKYNIQSVTVADPGTGDDTNWVAGGAKKITVVVTGPGVVITLSGFRGNY